MPGLASAQAEPHILYLAPLSVSAPVKVAEFAADKKGPLAHHALGGFFHDCALLLQPHQHFSLLQVQALGQAARDLKEKHEELKKYQGRHLRLFHTTRLYYPFNFGSTLSLSLSLLLLSSSHFY